MIWPHTVTFQEPTQSQLPSGQVSNEWDDVVDLTDIPARVIPVTIGSRVSGGDQDERTERMMLEQERYTLVLQGDREVGREMRAVTSHLDMTLDVVRVQRPTLYGSPATFTTLVEAERIGVALPAVGS